MQFKTLAGAAALTLLAGASTQALAASTGSFDNGNFENGTLSGWEVGGGSWHGGSYPQPGNYYPTQSGAGPVTVTNAGLDPRTGNQLNMVYGGNHSVMVNDARNDYSVAVIRQQVNNYTDTQIAFAYAAVLQSSHGPTDSDAFIITLQDLTTNTTLYSYNLNSATAPGVFNQYFNWYWTPWKTVTVAVTAGHDYLLSLLANDCPYGGHAGYAYLDGFGSVAPPPGPTPGGVPEPATWALMIAGFGMVGATLRRRQALAA